MYLLIIFLPLLSTILAGLFGSFLGRKGVSLITCSLIGLTALISSISFYEVALLGSPCVIKIVPWITKIEFIEVYWGFLFDTLTVTMLIVVTYVSTVVHIYSISYMSHDPHLQRFMSYLSFFTFFMLILVTADNFIQMFLGWEGVGIASFLLINFWTTRIQANKAAIKALIVNRIGDFGLSIAIFIIFLIFGSVNYSIVFSLVNNYTSIQLFFFNTEFNIITIICLLLFIGAVGKSAQIGLHTWLPDAMEGPTPVSALIHAATMVTAGVFLIVRCSPLFEYSSYILNLIIIIGSITSFFAATIGLFQNDLKKVIAYSTCSQLGYMIFACGISNYSVAMFHLVNHAFFKALLFLSAGAIIHALNDEQDMRKMGGLNRLLPFTYTMIIIGSLSLSGFPFLTGFFSKDLILELTYTKYNITGKLAHWLGILSVTFTTFYSYRLLFLVFIKETNSKLQSIKKIHESDLLISIPLILLAIGSIFIGWLTKDMLVGMGTNYWNNSIFILSNNINIFESEYIPYYIKLIPLIFSIIGVYFSYNLILVNINNINNLMLKKQLFFFLFYF